MANPRECVRVVLGGPVSSQDVWSIGLNMKVPASLVGVTTGELNTIAAAVAALFTTHYWKAGSGGGLQSNAPGTAFSTVRLYYYDTAGSLVAQGGANITPVVGTSTAPKPAYTARCFSLITAFFGRTARGRTYMPATGAPCDSATLQFADTAGAHAMFLAFLNALNALNPTIGGSANTWDLMVYSSVLSGGHFVTGLRLDSIPDTQRGRENKAVSTATVSGVVV